MSEWRGLANPERHAPTSVTDMAWCNVCDGPCYSPEACCCCLAAEVKRLERAEAAIARVREEVGTWPVALDKTVAACADSVLRALDGGAE